MGGLAMIEIRQLVRVAKRLQEASGYVELGMPQHALDCLVGLGELGPFEAEVELVRGEAYRAQHRYDDAAVALKAAAKRFPSPFDKSAWLALGLCYFQAGNKAKAAQMLARARGVGPSRKRPRPR